MNFMDSLTHLYFEAGCFVEVSGIERGVLPVCKTTHGATLQEGGRVAVRMAITLNIFLYSHITAKQRHRQTCKYNRNESRFKQSRIQKETYKRRVNIDWEIDMISDIYTWKETIQSQQDKEHMILYIWGTTGIKNILFKIIVIMYRLCV